MDRSRAVEERGARVAGRDARRQLLEGLPVTERRLRLAGIPTAMLEGGEGVPMVLLHGPGEYAAKWMRVMPALVTSHHVIAPDLPGHGASGSGDPASGAAGVLAWLDELIGQTCPSPPVLVGQILGGAIAACYAMAHGDRIRSLVLVDALGLAPFRPAPQFGAALMEFLAQPSEAAHDRLWALCAFDLAGLQERLGGRWDALKTYNLDRARSPEARRALHGLMERFGFPEIPAADLARLAVPTGMIWGRHDLATPVAIAEAVCARQGWPLRVIEEAGDDPPMEQPEKFLEALGVLAESLRPGRPGHR